MKKMARSVSGNFTCVSCSGSLPQFYLVLGGALIATYVLDLPGTIDMAGVRAQALHYTNYWIITHSFDGLPQWHGSILVTRGRRAFLSFVSTHLRRPHALWGKAGTSGAGPLRNLCGASRVARRSLFEARHSECHVAATTGDRERHSFCLILLRMHPCSLWKPCARPVALRRAPVEIVFFPLSVCGLLFSFLYRDEYFRDTFRYTLQGICLISVFVCAVRYPNWVPMRALNFRPIAFLGVLSYSLYLVHQVVLAAVGHELADFGGTRGRFARSRSVLPLRGFCTLP